MSRVLIEVCVDSAEGLAEAVAGGADRIELCAALDLGGLTPSVGLMQAAAQCPVPVLAMIRPRSGDFVFSPAEVAIMLADIAAARAAGLAGVVLGASLPDGRLDGVILGRLTKAASGLDLTLHRAFDLVPDLGVAIDLAVELGFRRILTSGQAATAAEGRAGLKRCFALAGGRIAIMPGSGVSAETVPALQGLPMTDLHGSCSVLGVAAPLGFGAPRRTSAARVRALKAAATGAMGDRMRSFLEIHDLASGETRLVLATNRLIEAPNWHPDGWLLVNGDGRLYRVPLDAPDLHPLDTGLAVRCNNDHGFSPDGRQIILSSHTDRGSEIFVMPAAGGTPRPVTQNAPSWWHGWSPDGARIVYAAARGGRGVDIWSCPASGGEEQRLTFGEGHSDGPDYAPDGAWVYYNCDRTGHAQIWRMRPDGTGHEQLFSDSLVNWFPHPSPDGRHVLYLAYPQGTEGHPRDRDVALVLMDPDGGNRRTVAAFNGGQGSINVPCWAPDGGAFAFMRYATPETA